MPSLHICTRQPPCAPMHRGLDRFSDLSTYQRLFQPLSNVVYPQQTTGRTRRSPGGVGVGVASHVR